MSAQVFGIERNHHVYGRKVVLWSDQKPLETIPEKPLATAPQHLRRLLLRLRQYDVESRYKPGPETYLADTLSHAYLPKTAHSLAEQEMERIHAIDFLPISADHCSRLSTTKPYSSNIVRLARSERSPTLRVTSPLYCER